MHSIHAFIISWTGQHENARSIAEAIRSAVDKVTVVFSDSDPRFLEDFDCASIKRPNELFWGDKFKTCLDSCDSDLMLIVHADCKSENWGLLAQRCRATMQANPGIGVWAPLIQGANLEIWKTHIAAIDGTSLMVVAQTDAIVFALARPVAARMKLANFERNVFGWGIDDMAAAFCFTHNMLVVVDRSILVEHPVSSGYSKEAAELQKAEFMKQLTVTEAVLHNLLWSRINANYTRMIAQSK